MHRRRHFPALTLCAAVLSVAPHAAAQCLEGCTAIHTITGESPGDQFGWEARVLGDVNGDGVAEFLVSAPTNDGGGFDAGRVYVYSGASGAELYRVSGSVANTQFGSSMNPVGDINQDGVPDFIVGTPGTLRGRATVHSGVDGRQLVAFAGESNGDVLGFRVAGGGDANLDGIPDLLIAAPRHDAAGSNSGRVYLISGADFTTLGTVDGEDAFDQFGNGLAFVGDIDGDGRDDFVVGAPDAGPASQGRAYLCRFDGVSIIREPAYLPGSPAFDFGLYFVGGRHDVDADGTPDIYVSDFSVNRAYVISGATGSVIWTLRGNNNGGFGIGELMPDIDNDGHADLILAAYVSNNGALQAGKVFIYSGRTGGVLQTLTHNIANAGFGFDAAGIGDLNHDGRTDYLISAASDPNQPGTVYVIAGGVTPYLDGDFDLDGDIDYSDLGVLLTDYGCASPPQVTCPGDLDGNGTTGLSDLGVLLANFGSP